MLGDGEKAHFSDAFKPMPLSRMRADTGSIEGVAKVSENWLESAIVGMQSIAAYFETVDRIALATLPTLCSPDLRELGGGNDNYVAALRGAHPIYANSPNNMGIILAFLHHRFIHKFSRLFYMTGPTVFPSLKFTCGNTIPLRNDDSHKASKKEKR